MTTATRPFEFDAGDLGPGSRARARAYLRQRAAHTRLAVKAWAARPLPRSAFLAAPSLAGMGLISCAAALRVGVWAGLGVAGVFCLWIDRRI